MALTLIADGATINKADINQAINLLQQPSGGQEIRKYVLSGNAYAANAIVSQYIASLSRGATPVSVSFDTTDTTKPAYFGTIATAHLTQGGFLIFVPYTSAQGGGAAAGNYTIQY